jgi:hypothetical protein
MAKNFSAGRGGFGGFGGPGVAATAPADLNISMPQMRHFENDTWTSIPFTTANFEYPMAISASYGAGTFYALAIPDDFADLYRLPPAVNNQLRALLAGDQFATLDAPDHVSLFIYDNHTLIVQNFQGQPVATRVTISQGTRLHDLLTDQNLSPPQGGGRGAGGFGAGPGATGRVGRGARGGGGGTAFDVQVPAHSFRVFAAE